MALKKILGALQSFDMRLPRTFGGHVILLSLFSLDFNLCLPHLQRGEFVVIIPSEHPVTTVVYVKPVVLDPAAGLPLEQPGNCQRLVRVVPSFIRCFTTE